MQLFDILYFLQIDPATSSLGKGLPFLPIKVNKKIQPIYKD